MNIRTLARDSASLPFRPRVLRVAVVSALGAYAAMLSGQADASCQQLSNDRTSYSYVVCYGSTQSTGEDVSVVQRGDLLVDASQFVGLDISGSLGGMWTLYSRGGGGVNEHDAGAGGALQLENTADIRLAGSTHGGFFQSLLSVGSVGGNGDNDNSNNNSDGGKGGAGGAVTIKNSGRLTIDPTVQPYISTNNIPLYGIHAVSRGGKGGEQNDSMFGNQKGGAGGTAGAVAVSNSGSILLGTLDQRITGYVDGAGISAKSLGGVGGPDNGPAGGAGSVNVDNTGDITVAWASSGGKEAYGIHALSLAGEGSESKDDSDDGGAGGNASAVSVRNGGKVQVDVTEAAGSYEGDGAAIAALSQGGKGGLGPKHDHIGGKGGVGGSVTVNLQSGGQVIARGNNLIGILAQSLGGEGGDGKDSAAIAGQGGGAGYGGQASSVAVGIDAATAIETDGGHASGVVAQSIGGGGGTGGTFVSVLGGQAGNGGSGGNASSVGVNAGGAITTRGHHSHGILAQSIAGSGGAGGIDVTVGIALGGDGAGGGEAGNVSVVQQGEITTSGYASHGLIAQSIGGGGGAAGGSIGLISIGGDAKGTEGSQGRDVAVTNVGSIRTSGPGSLGIVAQSIGGGGGSAGDSLGAIGVGGTGAAGGAGGYVGIYDIGTIETGGSHSPGVVAQSIGGGGGNGGDTLTFSSVATIAIGGSGAGGGDGGAVCLSSEGACDDSYSEGQRRLGTHGVYSPGIIAQNIGGGGGMGGSVVSVSGMSLGGVQLGGSGGGGGNAGQAGTVIDYKDLVINTGGAHSAGILAQSIGGGGGNGGNASYYNAAVGFNASLTMGGSGAKGGSGAGARVVLNNSHIGTGMDYGTADRDSYAPNDSFGILAQSIGGGGGNGGSASASTFIVAVPLDPTLPPVSFNLQAALGGTGGGGGNACASGDTSCLTQITLKGGSSVTTLGDGSHAVVSQSIGGGGGNGGDSSTLAIGVGSKRAISGAISFALGGAGGAASSGGKAEVNLGDAGAQHVDLPDSLPDLTAPLMAHPSSILTYGDFANGAQVQSIGGGGGNGGPGASDAYSVGGVASIAVTVGMGGAGGSGGQGGQVNAALNPNFVIHTAGSGSRGMVAQSIGGGGGTSQGGTMALAAGKGSTRAMLNLNLGREGGEGGDGDKVSADLQGAIRTEGGDADGVLLQSIGGGGGLGGSVGADASAHPILDRIGGGLIQRERIKDEGVAYEFNVGLGGFGGDGGKGGEVDFHFGGKVATQGDWAEGIVAQSIGGGGGTGGSSTAAGSRVSASINLAVGGVGGQGGDGGRVSARFNGSYGSHVSTAGYRAHGVILQSVGGGGGIGGDGSDRANGQLAIGGADGGKGGTAGVGGAIQAGAGSADWVEVGTGGSDAIGFVAQSVGGGGGMGGVGNSNSAFLTERDSIDVSVGGRGGKGNHGGAVNVDLGAGVQTLGDRSYGIVAQSIGGGGGMGGAGEASMLTSVGLGGRGGAGGDGGAIAFTLHQNSRVATNGAGAHAVVAQSIGGGGGIAGDSSKLLGLLSQGWLSLDEGGHGSGQAVDVSLIGTTITTTGDNSFGVLAQSIGGGGGLGGNEQSGFAGSTAGEGGSGSGGAVNINQSGSIKALGNGSTGIFAQSTGPDGAGTIRVKVDGTVQGGKGPQANAVWIAQGKSNVLEVGAAGQVLAGTGGAAVRYDGSNTDTSTLEISVAGLMSGDVQCNNATGGVEGCRVDVQPGGTVRDSSIYAANVNNAGLLMVGDVGDYRTLTIAGDFTQQSSGELVPAVDFVGHRASRLNVKGDAALDGKLRVAAGTLLPNRELTVLTLDGAVTGSLQVAANPIFEFTLREHNNERRISVSGADFHGGHPRLEGNQAGIANHLQGIWDRGGVDELGRLFAVLHDAVGNGPQSYRDRLTDLSPGTALAPAGQMAAGMVNFMGAMMSCPTLEGPYMGVGERDCVWGQVSRRNLDHDGGNGAPGFSFDTTTVQFGGQKQFKPNWFIGGSMAYQDSRLKGDTGRVNGSGDAGYAGVVIKHQAGPWVYSGSLAGGYGSFKLNRNLAIQDYDNTATGRPDVYSFGARLRAARHIELTEQLYLKPYVDLDAFYTRMSGYTESGNALALQVEGSDQFVVGLSPMLEFGGALKLDNGAVMRPYAYAGVSFLSKDSWSTTSRLRAAPAGTPGFTTKLPGDRVTGRFGAGVQFHAGSSLDVRLQYDGEASSKARSHAGQLKVMYHF